MELNEQIKKIIESQKSQIAILEQISKEFAEDDILLQNQKLSADIAEITKEFGQIFAKAQSFELENKQLKAELFAGINSDSKNATDLSAERTFSVIKHQKNVMATRLSEYERFIFLKIEALKDNIQAAQDGMKPQLEGQLLTLEGQLKIALQQQKELEEQQLADMRAVAQSGYQVIAQQPFSPQPPYPPVYNTGQPWDNQAKQKNKTSLEVNLGGKVTTVIGLVMILLGVIFGLRYTFEVLNSQLLKGIIAYALGLAFLLGGEMMNRKQRSPFSLGLTAGGISILFASTAVSYFNLGILPVLGALAICVVVTAIALYLSMRYDSQTIAIFALVGGYLPMSAIENSPIMIFSAMIYFLLFNLFILILSVSKRWLPVRFLSLSLHIVGTIYLLSLQGNGNVFGNSVYIMAGFVLYTAVVLIYPIVRSIPLKLGDTVLLGINTAVGCGLLFWLVNTNGLKAFNGAIAIVFCLLFFVLARMLGVMLKADSGARGMFYSTAFAFLVLAVPLQFSAEVTSLGWLIEGVALSVYGILRGRKWYRLSGFVISGLCVAWFILIDTLALGRLDSDIYIWRYSFITLGALIVYGVIRYSLWSVSQEGEQAKKITNIGWPIFSCIALVNVFFYLLYLISYSFNNLFTVISQGYWELFLGGVVALILGVSYRYLPILEEKFIRVMGLCLYVISFLYTVSINSKDYSYVLIENNARLVAVVAMVLYNIFVIIALHDFLKAVTQKSSNSQDLSLVLSVAGGLVFIIQILTAQARLSFASMIISFILIAVAFGLIITGFVAKRSMLRRVGLGLSLLSITKLFIIDLFFLESSQRILSYFVFGGVFIAISYLYQRFSRKLTEKEQVE